MGGNLGRHGMALRQFRGRYRAFNARGTQFVCFIHWGLKKICFFRGEKCREVMRITINQSPAYCKSRGMILYRPRAIA